MDYREIAKSHLPRGYKLCETRRKTDVLTARINQCDQGGQVLAEIDYHHKKIYTPKLDSIEALYLFFHEIGHYLMGHGVKGFPTHHQAEFEAEMIAQGLLKAYGLSLPREFKRNMKLYVKDCIEADERLNIPIVKAARRYVLTL